VRPRYPIYIPSKGRWQKDRALTVGVLQRERVPFRVVVEPPQADAYRRLAGDSVLELPFADLGQGSIPARNWIRDHAEAEGHGRHWQLDDNIIEFRRLWRGRRIPCDLGIALRVVEDLTERYQNVGVSGLNYQMFVPADTPVPFYRNVHVYSATLVNHAMPYRWRGRLNEDTDLCLQALVNGWATLLSNAFMANKLKTMAIGGGNTAELYGAGEGETDTLGRYEMARSLESSWPGLVKTSRKFGRYQHSVNWGAFRDLPLRPLSDSPAVVDEYGLVLEAVKEVQSTRLRTLLTDYPDDVRGAAIPEGWGGLPAFIPEPPPPKLTLEFSDERERDRLVKELGVTIAKKTGPAWSARYPPADREDLASLRFALKEAV
jgi:hypothetical protein